MLYVMNYMLCIFMLYMLHLFYSNKMYPSTSVPMFETGMDEEICIFFLVSSVLVRGMF